MGPLLGLLLAEDKGKGDMERTANRGEKKKEGLTSTARGRGACRSKSQSSVDDVRVETLHVSKPHLEVFVGGKGAIE